MCLNKASKFYDALLLRRKIYKIKVYEEHIMKSNKVFLTAVLSSLAVSLLVGCNNKQSSSTPAAADSSTPIPLTYDEPRPLEIGDIVKEWGHIADYEKVPLAIPNSTAGSGEGTIMEDFGNGDKYSLKYVVKVGNNQRGYISSDALDEPYFTEDDAKNGDIISLYLYAPANSNVASLQLQVMPSSGNNAILGDEITITEENEEKWIRSVISFDTLETLGSIRVIFKAIDDSKDVTFFVDDINIVLGEETVKTEYEFNDESLYQAYEDYDIKIGTCMAANGLRNTEMRKIAKDNFNSLTAENEAKPEHVLDQNACRELSDKSQVAITMKPFEKLYNFAEANHIGVRHHTFVWYSQTPSWFFTEDYNGGKQASRELMLKRMDSFMKEMIEGFNDRWPGLVYAIDVVNEAVGNGGAGFNKNNKWFDTIGEDFVYQAFKCAYKYKDPDQDLYYNDYDYDYNVNNCQKALSDDILGQAIREGLVDGVGIQGHVDSDQSMDVLISDAKMIKEKGLKCQITELDITVSGSDDAAWNKQKAAYKRLMSKILENNATGETEINGVIVWGITDNSSWKSYQNPLLFNNSYGKKPCYYGMLEAIEEFEDN